MIVAGLGFRRGVHAEDIEFALKQAIQALSPRLERLDGVAVPLAKAEEGALIAVVKSHRFKLIPISQSELEAAGSGAVTRSAKSLEVMNVPSVAEAAALAGAGETARLLVPRVVHGGVTCAIAESVSAQ